MDLELINQEVEDFINKSQYKEALERINQISAKKLTDNLILKRSICYAGTQQIPEAIEDLNYLIRKGVDLPSATYSIALLYEKQGEVAKATYFYRQAMKYDETREEARRSYEQLSNREVESETERILEIEPYIPNVTFADVVGLKDVKEYLTKNVINAIRHEDFFSIHSQKAGGGVILYGSPGGGKTLIAKALGGELNLPFINAKAMISTGIPFINVETSQIIGQYQGVTEKNIKTVWEQARAISPCILFIDEFENLGAKRSSYGGDDRHGGSSGMKMAVSALLSAMDGLSSNEKVFVVATTNRPWDLDAAIRRPGRFKDIIYIAPPNFKQRKEAFMYHMKGRLYEKDINFNRLARASVGYSQADIAGCVNTVYIEHIAKEIKTEESRAKKEGRKMYKATQLQKKQMIKSVCMGEMLNYMFHNKGSLEAWYIQARQELIGKYSTQIIDGKRHKTWSSGNMEPDEVAQYKNLIKDIKKYVKFKSMRTSGLLKAFLIPF
jgi:SpoVK/Ycf46/Vps4 family AAA+-type ATPase